ncbi:MULTISPECIES: ribosome biogenesis GTPase Der [unclassified Undibacterium]|uniref:ribosome biogenesis GTPase Der n=1 Tax=unclassified Undibacterium TaxID=2630295 RepID=UPI002AC9CF4A|nr:MULTISPECIES: ribosome biogenesis GTPase Der [unclassified Undibacterium]MEB0138365.1 ribosome biogenesis GTPase Der [Undibacterium sp. CCC2.1]MEB0172742.1 ribosome biogenesis GTPase Der [Undibacterium sp. CCC1.1]MEB0174740.1 ribosome biogenesis GTPase Der [Undibacterium sp. CCC3.4]MEB0213937.1 ribosome biogenesis GTPase Der [Undibacterium sp. 5I2]WPX42661.1 ribosome biogenesis GTPase Der [Undibacterium sp. CCC3.4]
MKPVIALIGRPNVGKSTLFNRLTRSRDALVADLPGLTRDRHYGEGRVGERPFLVIDTGGFEPVAKDGILHEMAKQTKQAVAEADVVIFIVDGRQGLTPHDKTITDFLRKSGRSVMLVVNKAEGMRYSNVTADFYELGLGDPYVISSAHGDGVTDLVEEALDIAFAQRPPEVEEPESAVRGIRIAIVGRPNVGKSTLVNTLLGEERVIAFDMPGTTRDSIEIPFERDGKHYSLIDTAGIRRRGKVFEAIEKFSVVKTLQSVSEANVVLLLLDAQQDISEQDAHIAGFILESGRALVVGVNKWDGLQSERRDEIKFDIERKLNFLTFAKFHFISALKSTGLAPLMKSIDSAYEAAMANLSTPKLTRALIEAVEHQQPKRKGSIRPKLRYAHQGGQNPPIIVIHGNALEAVGDVYKRYLEKHFRETFSLTGTPLRIEMRSGKNPFDKSK